jgi:hypothetical protein
MPTANIAGISTVSNISHATHDIIVKTKFLKRRRNNDGSRNAESLRECYLTSPVPQVCPRDNHGSARDRPTTIVIKGPHSELPRSRTQNSSTARRCMSNLATNKTNYIVAG